jgi:hypothetical protein
MPERPLRTTLAAATGEKGVAAGEAFAMPATPDSLAEMRRGLASLANREAQRDYMQRIVDDAGVSLSPLAAWVLVRLESDSNADVDSLVSAHGIDPTAMSNAVAQLETGGFLTIPVPSNGAVRRATDAGRDVLARIVAVRRSHIARAAREWDTGEQDAVPLRAIERELVPDPPPRSS